MNKKNLIVFLIALLSSVKLANAEVSLDLEGCFALDHFAKSVSVSIHEQAGIIPQKHICLSIAGEQQFKNMSTINHLLAGIDYRFILGNITIPVGAIGGVEILSVGNFNARTPFAGLHTGCYYTFFDNVSLRLNYYGQWYFDKETVFGGKVFIGLGYSLHFRSK